MTKLKAIISDFDGTLSHDGSIDPKVITKINAFIKQGYIFSIATGRAYQGLIAKICQDLNLSDLHIVRGGSEIISRQSGQVIWGKYIDPEAIPKIIAFLQSHQNIFVSAEHADFIYTVGGKSHEEFGPGAVFKSLDDLPSKVVPKIMLPPFHPSQTIEPIFDQLKQKFPNLHIVKTTSKKGMGIDINASGAGKHVAVLEYAKLVGLDPHQMLGVGDSYNDYPLLSACGLKIAVNHAPPELKEIADHVISDKPTGINEAIDIFYNQNK